MHTILVVSRDDLRPQLAKTVLGKSNVDFLLARDPEAAWQTARDHRIRLAILALPDHAQSEALVRRLRGDEATRGAGVLVGLPRATPVEEEAVRRAGASMVLVGPIEPFLWNEPLERLLNVASRRAATIPVRFWVWYRLSEEEAPVRCLALNVSVHGMLLETDAALEVESDARLEVEFVLPGRDFPLRCLARVARDAGSEGSRHRLGIEFVGLSAEARERIAAFVEAGSQR